ncbi:tryptophan synthase subunit beta, partial [Bacillus cereus]
MSTYTLPNEKGHFGKYGGRFIPETLIQAVKELESAYQEAVKDKGFQEQLHSLLANYVGRETPLYYAENLTEFCGGAKIYLKREDLNHTGAH